MTKPETLQFFDKIISDYHVSIEFNAEVYGMRRLEGKGGARFQVESSQGVYESKVLACAIGIFGRPNKPKDYRLAPTPTLWRIETGSPRPMCFDFSGELR